MKRKNPLAWRIRLSLFVVVALYGFINARFSKEIDGESRSTVALTESNEDVGHFFQGRHLLQAVTTPQPQPSAKLNKDGGKPKRKKHHTKVLNCTPPAIEEFPDDLMTQKQRLYGGFLLYLIVVLYMFWGIAVVCDDYFVPVLEIICAKLEMQPDVAGATFMALGSSAPELFASVIGVFITKGDIGVGTILGSAVFNVLFVIGICGVLAGQVLELAWWPLVRDLGFYLFSLIILMVVMYDDIILWTEALFMVLFYPTYLIMMYFNSRIESYLYRITNTIPPHKKTDDIKYEAVLNAEDEVKEEGEEKAKDKDVEAQNEDGTTEEEKIENEEDKKADDAEPEADKKDEEATTTGDGEEDKDKDKDKSPTTETEEKDKGQDKSPSEKTEHPLLDSLDLEEDVSVESPWVIPDGGFAKLCWLLGLPISVMYYYTIPDVRKKSCQKWCPVSFIVCIIWIGVTSYVLVWMVTILGFTFGIPDTVMGLSLIAFGSSVPDCLSSLFVAQKGEGDMAVSHTVGSNVFDILLCLGIPWLVKTTMWEYDSAVIINSHGLFISSFFILGSIFVTFFIIYYHKFVLNKKVGYIYLVTYFIFMTISIIVEMNCIGNVNPPMCHVDY